MLDLGAYQQSPVYSGISAVDLEGGILPQTQVLGIPRANELSIEFSHLQTNLLDLEVGLFISVKFRMLKVRRCEEELTLEKEV